MLKFRLIPTIAAALFFFPASAFSAPVSSQGGVKTVWHCVPTTFRKCKVDKNGREYDCKTSKGEKCTAVGGPGSGKTKK